MCLLKLHAELGIMGVELLLDAGGTLLGRDLGEVPALFLGFSFLDGSASLEAAEFKRVTFFEGILADSGMGFFVDLFQVVSFDFSSDETGELPFEGLFVFFFQTFHVFGDVATEDVLFVYFSVGLEVLTVLLGTREAAVVVGDIQTTIEAPFMAPNTRAPVVVRFKPTSNKALKGAFPSASTSTLKSSPSTSS